MPGRNTFPATSTMIVAGSVGGIGIVIGFALAEVPAITLEDALPAESEKKITPKASAPASAK